MIVDPNEPAFPFQHHQSPGSEVSTGIPLRLWIATQLLSGTSTATTAKEAASERDARLRGALGDADALIRLHNDRNATAEEAAKP